ncbi:cupin domain-containing protein [Burkholderia stagnalis]|uniref:cupin domain-containing protein n=1 Tax=Burkholderia stagnalis TaxID=1503054 RepID=UPI0002D7BB63|nr:cupin domain-containing protein [Burkholderia stagnalis]
MNATEAASTDAIAVGELTIRYLVDGTATGGIGVFELTVPPGAQVPPPHSHARNEECVYVLSGTLRYSVDRVVRELAPGDWMFSPRGSAHHFSNPHEETARALVVMSPDIGARYFRDIAAVVKAGGPHNRERLVEVMVRYGLAPAKPAM